MRELLRMGPQASVVCTQRGVGWGMDGMGFRSFLFSFFL